MRMVEKKKVCFDNKYVLGLTENIVIQGKNGQKEKVIARIDTGATQSSMDVKLAAQLQLGPIIKTKFVKSASGSSIRPIVEVKIELAGHEINAEFSLANRSHLKYRVLIGQNILDERFIIDPSKK